MASKPLHDTELIALLNSRFGTKPTVQYYLRRAKDASARAKVALANQNPYALGAEAQTMIANIEMIANIIGDDNVNLSENVDTKTTNTPSKQK